MIVVGFGRASVQNEIDVRTWEQLSGRRYLLEVGGGGVGVFLLQALH